MRIRIRLRNIIIQCLLLLKIDKVISSLEELRSNLYIARLKKDYGIIIKYFPQGHGGIHIAGDIKNFFIHPTSHLKSGTFIETSGGVEIGAYFHTGRGLTIFSTNHNYKSKKFVPYDETDIPRKVVIGDCVWIGANVTLAPGVRIEDGAIVSTGSVVFGLVPKCAIVRGNPATIIGYRDITTFDDLFSKHSFY